APAFSRRSRGVRLKSRSEIMVAQGIRWNPDRQRETQASFWLRQHGFDASRAQKYAHAMTRVQSPINVEKWIEENAEKFKPPVSNRYLYDGRDFFVMVIKGPNAR